VKKILGGSDNSPENFSKIFINYRNFQKTFGKFSKNVEQKKNKISEDWEMVSPHPPPARDTPGRVTSPALKFFDFSWQNMINLLFDV